MSQATHGGKQVLADDGFLYTKPRGQSEEVLEAVLSSAASGEKGSK